MRKYLYIRCLRVFLLLNVSCICASAQTMLSHSSKIMEVYTDERGQTLVLDENKKLSLYTSNFRSSILNEGTDPGQWISRDSHLYYIKDSCLYLSVANQLKPVLCPAPSNIMGVNEHLVWCDDVEQIRIYSLDEELCIDVFPWAGTPVLNVVGDTNKIIVLFEDRFIDLCNDLDPVSFPYKATDACIWNNSVLISSKSSGIWVFRNGKLRKLFVPGIMVPQSIEEMALMRESLWIKAQGGDLFHFDLDRQILNPVAISVDNFAVDSWNVVHYSSGKKLYTDPGFIHNVQPKLVIDQLTINGREFEAADSMAIYQGDVLQLRSSAYYPDASRTIVCEYQLNGGSWQRYDTDFLLSFEEARPYVLSLRCGLDGESMSFVRSFKCDVQQKLSLSLWPYVLAVVLIVFSLLGLAWWSAESRNSKLEERHKALEMKLSLMRERQKFQQSRMSPHFLFNALNGIKGLVADNENKIARQAIDGFARIMRTILEDSEKERIELGDELKFLKAYLSLEQIIRNSSFEYRIEDNSSANCSLPPMMIQPFIENAIIHGISKVEGAGRIRLAIEDAGQYIRVTIEDNGKGFDQEGSRDHKSKAVGIFEARAAAIDKWRTMPAVRYEDIPGQGGEIIGLRCILHIAK